MRQEWNFSEQEERDCRGRILLPFLQAFRFRPVQRPAQTFTAETIFGRKLHRYEPRNNSFSSPG
jgi:hypothetical protein